MFEGSGTSRHLQITVSALLAIASSPFVIVGVWLILHRLSNAQYEYLPILIGIILFGVGFFGLLLAWRLFKVKGVKQGGGLLSPFAYKALGFIFLIIALVSGLSSLQDFSLISMFRAISSFLIAYFCFIAARHRGAMRSLPTWKNIND